MRNLSVVSAVVLILLIQSSFAQNSTLPGKPLPPPAVSAGADQKAGVAMLNPPTSVPTDADKKAAVLMGDSANPADNKGD